MTKKYSAKRYTASRRFSENNTEEKYIFIFCDKDHNFFTVSSQGNALPLLSYQFAYHSTYSPEDFDYLRDNLDDVMLFSKKDFAKKDDNRAYDAVMDVWGPFIHQQRYSLYFEDHEYDEGYGDFFKEKQIFELISVSIPGLVSFKNKETYCWEERICSVDTMWWPPKVVKLSPFEIIIHRV